MIHYAYVYIATAGSVLAGKEDEFAREIHSLSQLPEMDMMKFEEMIDKIRAYVAEVRIYTGNRK